MYRYSISWISNEVIDKVTKLIILVLSIACLNVLQFISGPLRSIHCVKLTTHSSSPSTHLSNHLSNQLSCYPLTVLFLIHSETVAWNHSFMVLSTHSLTHSTQVLLARRSVSSVSASVSSVSTSVSTRF